MRYYVELAVPAGTPINAPTVAEIKLTPGLIDHVSLYFPPGSGGWLNVQLWLNGYQLVPWERGTWQRGDDVLLPDFGRYEVKEEPYLCIVKAYNTGALYTHSVMVAVELTPLQAVAGGQGGLSLMGMRFE
jgi:hypothetical protein